MVTERLANHMTDEQMEVLVQRLLCKMTEINSMMKNGEFIVAYEKLGGVHKNLSQLGTALQSRKISIQTATPIALKINGTDTTSHADVLSYDEILKLGGEDPSRTLSVIYYPPQGRGQPRMVSRGQTVQVSQWGRFEMADTSNA
jgi:hypothetical protein